MINRKNEQRLLRHAGTDLFKLHNPIGSEKKLIALLKIQSKELGHPDNCLNIVDIRDWMRHFSLLAENLQPNQINNTEKFPLLSATLFCLASLHKELKNIPIAMVLIRQTRNIAKLFKDEDRYYEAMGLEADILYQLLKEQYLGINSSSIYQDCRQMFRDYLNIDFPLQLSEINESENKLAIQFSLLMDLYTQEKEHLEKSIKADYNSTMEKMLNTDHVQLTEELYMAIIKHWKSSKKLQLMGRDELEVYVNRQTIDFIATARNINSHERLSKFTEIFEYSYNRYEVYGDPSLLDRFIKLQQYVSDDFMGMDRLLDHSYSAEIIHHSYSQLFLHVAEAICSGSQDKCFPALKRSFEYAKIVVAKGLSVQSEPVSRELFCLHSRLSGMILDIAERSRNNSLVNMVLNDWIGFLGQFSNIKPPEHVLRYVFDGINELFLRRKNKPFLHFTVELRSMVEKLLLKTPPVELYRCSITVLFYQTIISLWQSDFSLAKRFLHKISRYLADHIGSNKYKYGRSIIINEFTHDVLRPLLDYLLQFPDKNLLLETVGLLESIMTFSSSDLTNINFYCSSTNTPKHSKAVVFKDNLTRGLVMSRNDYLPKLPDGKLIYFYQSLENFWIISQHNGILSEPICLTTEYSNYCQVVETAREYTTLIRKAVESVDAGRLPDKCDIQRLDECCRFLSEIFLKKSGVFEGLKEGDHIFLETSGADIFNLIFDALYAPDGRRVYERFRVVNTLSVRHLTGLMKSRNPAPTSIRYAPLSHDIDVLGQVSMSPNETVASEFDQIKMPLEVVCPDKGTEDLEESVARLFRRDASSKQACSMILALHGRPDEKDGRFLLKMGGNDVDLADFTEALVNVPTVRFEDICLYNCFSDRISYQGDLSFARVLALSLGVRRIISSPFKQLLLTRYLYASYFRNLGMGMPAIDAYRTALEEYLGRVREASYTGLGEHPELLPAYLTQRFTGNPLPVQVRK